MHKMLTIYIYLIEYHVTYMENVCNRSTATIYLKSISHCCNMVGSSMPFSPVPPYTTSLMPTYASSFILSVDGKVVENNVQFIAFMGPPDPPRRRMASVTASILTALVLVIDKCVCVM